MNIWPSQRVVGLPIMNWYTRAFLSDLSAAVYEMLRWCAEQSQSAVKNVEVSPPFVLVQRADIAMTREQVFIAKVGSLGKTRERFLKEQVFHV